ncbi:MAG: hypothetical protein Fur0010_01910 [Bdellovibrio sp.]
MKLLSRIVFISLICFSANAEDIIQSLKKMNVVYYASVGHESDEYKALVIESNADHQFRLYDESGKIVLSDSFPILTDAFHHLKVLDLPADNGPFLMIVTQRGIHGESLKLYSLKEMKLIKNYTSTMPVNWQVFEDRIEIQCYGPKASNGEESKENYVFPEKKK